MIHYHTNKFLDNKTILVEIVKHLPGKHNQERHAGKTGRQIVDLRELPQALSEQIYEIQLNANTYMSPSNRFQKNELVDTEYGDAVVAAFKPGKHIAFGGSSTYGGTYTLVVVNGENAGKTFNYNVDQHGSAHQVFSKGFDPRRERYNDNLKREEENNERVANLFAEHFGVDNETAYLITNKSWIGKKYGNPAVLDSTFLVNGSDGEYTDYNINVVDNYGQDILRLTQEARRGDGKLLLRYHIDGPLTDKKEPKITVEQLPDDSNSGEDFEHLLNLPAPQVFGVQSITIEKPMRKQLFTFAWLGANVETALGKSNLLYYLDNGQQLPFVQGTNAKFPQTDREQELMESTVKFTF